MTHPENKALDNWLAKQRPEVVLEPDRPIIDPHHHLWDLRRMSGEPLDSFQQKVYLIEEMTNDITQSGHNVVQTVFAQCMAFYRLSGDPTLRSVGETEFANGIAAMSASGLYGPSRLCTGIFSEVDLRNGQDAEPALQAHIAASANFRGIRGLFPSDLNDEYLAGYALLAKYDLSFDNYSPDVRRLSVLAELASRQPEVPVIVNHLGGKIDPEAPAERITQWQEGLKTIARAPNAFLKVGGAQQRVGPWEPSFHMNRSPTPMDSEALCETLYPFYEFAINTFGPERCMFESNFPVDKESVSYRSLWNLFKRIANKAGYSESEKQALFSGTAARAYRLTPPQPN